MKTNFQFKLIISCENDPEVCNELRKIYSSNYGVWSNSGAPIKMSLGFFMKEMSNFSLLVLYLKEEIIGFCAFIPTFVDKIFSIIIRTLVIKKKYRRIGYGTRLVRRLVKFNEVDPDLICCPDRPTLGILSRNPIALRILENLEELDYTRVLSLDEIRKYRYLIDGNFSTFMQRPFIINSRFPASQEGIPKSMISWATACYGELGEGDEWIIFMKPR